MAMTEPPVPRSPELDQAVTGEPPATLARAEAVASGPSRGAREGLFAAVALVLLVIVPLGLLTRAGWDPLIDLDRAVSDELVVPGRGTGVDVLRLLTTFGDIRTRFVLLLPLVVWLAIVRRWQLVGFLVVAGFGASLVNHQLKTIFDRERPSYPNTIDFDGLSFPSGHSTGAAVLAAVLVVVGWPVLAGVWRWIWVTAAALMIIAVGFTRITLGAHYLTDVIAGWSTGTAWVLLLAVVLQVWPGQAGALSGREPAERS
jgi:undecaprenyl-diphosphatase